MSYAETALSWTPAGPEDSVLVTNINNRNNVLERSGAARGAPEILAANLTCLIVVFAPLPRPDWFLIDRYLCTGALMRCRLLLVGNKNDLARDQANHADADADEIRNYMACGYEYLSVSAKDSGSLGDLRKCLENEIGIMVGQSGAGKSSLINQLVPAAEITVGAVSKATSEGVHTTTASAMHRLPNGGRLIDSPGVREFVPVAGDALEIQQGYPEIFQAAQECRFSNCRHLREPDCAVKQARDDGRLSPRRYESYKRVLNSLPP